MRVKGVRFRGCGGCRVLGVEFFSVQVQGVGLREESWNPLSYPQSHPVRKTSASSHTGSNAWETRRCYAKAILHTADSHCSSTKSTSSAPPICI